MKISGIIEKGWFKCIVVGIFIIFILIFLWFIGWEEKMCYSERSLLDEMRSWSWGMSI